MKDHVAFKAAEDSRKLTLPQKPEDYPFALPADFKAPEGVTLDLNDKAPELPLFRAWAHKAGLTKEQFTEALGVWGSVKMLEQQTLMNAKAAELQKLGANGTARNTAVRTWLTAQLGDKAAPFLEMPVIASMVEGWESIMQKFTTQGGTGPQSAHREMPEGDGKIPGYESMGFMQRRAAQDALAQRKKAS